MKKNSLIICTIFIPYLSSAQTVSFVQATGSPINIGYSSLRGLTVTDVNKDGKKDFIIGSSYGTKTAVYLGAGNGQFTQAPGSPYSSGAGPQYHVLADFNHDSNLDIATANYNGDSTSILLGTGTGSFALSSTLPTGSLGYGIDTSDFNMDGNIDLVTVAAGANAAYVFLGNGNGSFSVAPSSPIATGTMPYHVSTGFFNTDAYPDFAVANGSSHDVSVFLGTGTGSFTPAPGSPYAAGSEPRTLCVKDINSDSRPDLIVANGGGNSITVLLGQANGSFIASAGSPLTTGSYAYQPSVADYDGDGQLDIAVTAGLSNAINIFLGSGNGSFSSAMGSPISVGTDPQPLGSGDLDGDGKTDLLVGDYTSTYVTVLLNTNRTGIHDYNKSNAVEIFPNPVTNKIIITVNNLKEGMSFIIYNTIGQEVGNMPVINTENTYMRGNMNPGVYFYKITDQNGTLSSGKLVFE